MAADPRNPLTGARSFPPRPAGDVGEDARADTPGDALGRPAPGRPGGAADAARADLGDAADLTARSAPDGPQRAADAGHRPRTGAGAPDRARSAADRSRPGRAGDTDTVRGVRPPEGEAVFAGEVGSTGGDRTGDGPAPAWSGPAVPAADTRRPVRARRAADRTESRSPRRSPPHPHDVPADLSRPGTEHAATADELSGHPGDGETQAAPETLAVPDAAVSLDDVPRVLVSHGCWYPSVDPGGRHVAFICDRGGVPQLWEGPVDGDDVHLLDADPDPVTEVAWSPDGRWIAYTTAPGGSEHTRVLCVRPDGTGRRVLAGGEPGTSAYLGCWARDGSALAVTVAEAPARLPPTGAEAGAASTEHSGAIGPGAGAPTPLPPVSGAAETVHPEGWTVRDGRATLLGAPSVPAPPTGHTATVSTAGHATAAAEPGPRTLSAYLVDPDGQAAPVLVASEREAATLRVCDISGDGRLALVRRGPRARREALVVRIRDQRVTCAVPVADGDPWIGAFAPDARTLWLRSDHEREHAALYAIALDPRGGRTGLTVAAQRDGSGLELLTLDRDGRGAVLSWNVRGVSELEVTPLVPGTPLDRTRAVPLPHEVVTRVAATADPDAPVVALSGSLRRPGVWWLPQGAALRTPWSSRDEDVVAPGVHRPVRPVPMRPRARDGLDLGGWYYRAPGRSPREPAPCVLHLHGGPEEQERPVFDPLYHELLGRGLDVFAPDVRGSSGYGRSFVDADLGRGRFAAIEDVADCAAHVVAKGLADPLRLAVMGHSYGGYLVMASLVWHPELFRTGVPVCGMSSFATFFAGTEPWLAQSAAHKYGHPERDRELLHALSPMSRVDALRVPVLAVHGEHDTNVPPGESEQFVRAARERGVDAELLVLRDEGHDFRRSDNRRAFRRAAADWIQRHLTG
ncbi:prolyl oligopeptidase family serine peptidase [Streptomyces misionensis]|uniref:prolyl oligopeptidase family serine peptidase n=1 Tax=Streptomyces misionensis TaxID=67331 RepID=UPI003F4CEB6A